MLREVQAFQFLILADAQADDRIDDLQQNGTSQSTSTRSSCQHRDDLIDELRRIILEQPVGARGIDRLFGKQAGEDDANDAANAM